MNLLLDTSVLIDVLRAKKRRRDLLASLVRANHDLATTIFNVAELYAGMRPGEESATETLLTTLPCFDLTPAAARLAGKLKFDFARKGRTLALADTLIAAIALENSCHLLTDNPKDFPIPSLNLYPLP